MENIQKWLNKAYVQFAELGPENISIQKIGQETGLSRTSFYYHFENKESLIEQLLSMHNDISTEFRKLLKSNCQTLLPDIHVIVQQFPLSLKFHRQLFLNRNNPLYNFNYNHLNSLSNPILIPLVKDYYNLNIHDSTLKDLWNTVIDTWYARLDITQINIKHMSALTDEIMETVLKFAKETQAQKQNK